MKLSIIISAFLLAIFAFLIVPRQQKIKTLTSKWEKINAPTTGKLSATGLNAQQSSSRSAQIDRKKGDRKKTVQAFSKKIAEFANKMKKAEKGGTVNESELREEVLGIMDTMTTMSISDLKLLVNTLASDPSIKDEDKAEILMTPIRQIFGTKPELALNLIMESDEKLSLIRTDNGELLTQYAEKSPEAATTWLTKHQSQLGESANGMKMQLLSATAKNDFPKALALISSWNLDKSANAYGSLAMSVTDGSKDLFLKMLQSEKTTDQQRKIAIIRLSESPLIQNDFETASTWLNSPDVGGANKDTFIGNLHYFSVEKNPAQWLSWIGAKDTQVASSQKATQRILSEWAKEDFVRAGEWINTQEKGTSKDVAIATYAATLSAEEPAAAADWASSLPEGPGRKGLLQSIYNSLQKKDPAAAATLATKYHLSTE